MLKRKELKFKNQKQKSDFEKFTRNHLEHIIACAKLPQFLVRSIRCGRLSAPAAMEIEIDHKYIEVVIDYDETYAVDNFIDKKDYEELIRTLCHEVSHIPTSELDENLDIDNNSKKQSFWFERCTQAVSLWLYDSYTQYMINNGISHATGA